MTITGTNFVRFTRHGLQSLRQPWAKARDRFKVRRHALKLRFWDERHLGPPGMILDHSYESIKSLPGEGIYEMRVSDEIGGQSNIRVIFFDPPRAWVPNRLEARPLPIVWVFEAFPKRRNDFTTADRVRFQAAKRLLFHRVYSG